MTNLTQALRALPLAAFLAAVTPVGAQPQQPLSPRELWLQTLQAQKARERPSA